MGLRIARILFGALFACLLAMAPAAARTPVAPTAHVAVHPLPPMGQNAVPFDAEKATDAYLAQVHGTARARSDAYFEGGYWLLAIDALYALLACGLLLWLKVSAWMRDNAARITRSRFWQVPIYVVQFTIVLTVVTFPLTVYEQFFREHAYGLSNQSFLQWLGDFGILTGVNIVAFAVLLTLLYAVVRGARETWWLWGTVVTLAFVMFLQFVAPVFVAPLINNYTPLKDGPLKEKILSVARAEGIPATDVYEYDASRQTKEISANVSGLFGTTRISLNDNLLKRCSEREILAVVGHEMGHYVLSHTFIFLPWFAAIILLGFAFVNWGFRRLAGLFGGNWDVRTIDDPAGLPLIYALLTAYLFVMTPALNTLSRLAESQADIFGVNAVRQPDGFATAVLKLSEYRKLDPSPLEEFVFYDHPSGRNRIHMMMQWKAEHLHDPDIAAGPVSPQ